MFFAFLIFFPFPLIFFNFLKFSLFLFVFLWFSLIFFDFLWFSLIFSGFSLIFFDFGAVSGRFRDGFEVGKYRDGFGTALGAQGRIFRGGKPRICALLARASGHQISSMVSYLREHLGIRAPKSHRSIGDFMGVILPMEAPILEGPRGDFPYLSYPDLDGCPVWASGRRRGLPFRPYLHARISRISGRRTTPSNNNNNIFLQP